MYKKHINRLEKDFYDISELRVDDRDNHKKQLIKEYQSYVDKWLKSGDMSPNRVFSWYIVWHLDIGDIGKFIKYCLAGLERNQRTPDKYYGKDRTLIKKGFSSNLAEFLYDGVHGWATEQINEGRSPRPYFDQAYTRLLEKTDYMHKIVRVKMHILQAKICFNLEYPKADNDEERKAYLVNAILATRWAKKVDKQAKCKTLHDKIVREMVKKDWPGLWELPESKPDGGTAI